MNSILIMFHLESVSGYAMDTLLPVFFRMAKTLLGDERKIHISFTRLNGGAYQQLLPCFDQLIEFDPLSKDRKQHIFIEQYVKDNYIDVVFGFDLALKQPCFSSLRRAGVKKIIGYQGAPMSGLNSGIKLFAKKLEVLLTSNVPDHFIFESTAMARTAYEGRGVSRDKVSIVHLGVDEEKFKPCDTAYAYEAFNIPEERRILYFSGHMEERKGVAVLMQSAKELYEKHGRRDFHWLILGNRKGEEVPFLKMLSDSGAKQYVTFAGYRKDVEKIIPSCYLGAIASTGWDSFTVSSLEMAACGLPLIVSRLQGLAETIDEGETGLAFEPGEYTALTSHIMALLDDPEKRALMSNNARQRILGGFTKDIQVKNLVDIMNKVAA